MVVLRFRISITRVPALTSLNRKVHMLKCEISTGSGECPSMQWVLFSVYVGTFDELLFEVLHEEDGLRSL